MDKVLDRIATALEQIASNLAGYTTPSVVPSTDVLPGATPTPAAKVKTKKAKVEAPVAEETPVNESEVVQPKTITLVEVADQVRKLVASDPVNGHKNATSVLSAFGAKRISELKPEDFPGVIKKIMTILEAK